jgi:osmotically-inducible protein OsmY
MKLKLASVGIIAALGFAACSTETNTNVNRAANNPNSNTGVVTNSNGNSNSLSPITTTNTNSRSSINYNGTAKDNEGQRSSVEQQAREAGGKIGTGAEDWWIWAKTNAALTTSSTLSSSAGIDVDVENNKITLRGTVPQQKDIAEADKIAKGIDGQKGVSNQLKVGAANSTTNSNARTNTNTK